MNENVLPSVLSPASFTVVADDVSMADLYLSAHTCYLDEDADAEWTEAWRACDPSDGDPWDHDPLRDDEIWLVSALAGA